MPTSSLDFISTPFDSDFFEEVVFVRVEVEGLFESKFLEEVVEVRAGDDLVCPWFLFGLGVGLLAALRSLFISAISISFLSIGALSEFFGSFVTALFESELRTGVEVELRARGIFEMDRRGLW